MNEKMKNITIFIAVVLIAVALIFCFKPKSSPLYKINVDGHSYVFKYNPKDSMKISCNDPEGLQIAAFKAKRIVILFNGTSSKDNALFSVIGQNIVLKLKPYFAFQGIPKLYSASVEGNYTPVDGDLRVYLVGPRTGSNGTYVYIDGNNVTVSGNTTYGARMAGDKFILTIMGFYDKHN